MTENVGKIFYEVDAKTKTAIEDLEEVRKSNRKLQDSFEKTDDVVKKTNDSVKKTTKSASDSVSSSNKKIQTQINKTSKSFKLQRGAAQQVGFQLQDFAVQVQGGTSALVALGQQGSQVLGIFGAGGALAGALLAISTAIAGPLIESVTGADDEIDDLDDVVKRLGRSFDTVAGESDRLSQELRELARVSTDAVRLRLIVEQEEAQRAIEQASSGISEAVTDALLTDTLIPLAGIAETFARPIAFIGFGTLESLADAANLTTSEVLDLQAAVSKAANTGSEEAFSELAGIVADLSKKYGKSNDSVNEMTKSLSGQIQTAIGASRALKRLKDVNENLDDAIATSSSQDRKFRDPEGDRLAAIFEARRKAGLQLIEQTNKQFQDEQTIADEQLTRRLEGIAAANLAESDARQAEVEVRSLHAQKLAEIDKKLTDSQFKEAQRRLSAKQVEVNAYMQLGRQLTNFVSETGVEQTALGKAVFLANQALAVANIIVSTQVAGARALAEGGSVAGPALKARVEALGYASAGIAAGVSIGKTFAGRQVGGPVSAGTPYRINETGPEILQAGGQQYLVPDQNGRVLNGAQSGRLGSMPNVNIVINNNAPVQVDVEQSVQDNGLTLGILITDITERGQLAGAIERTYPNITRRTD